MLAVEHGYQRVKFADPLKSALRRILEFTALDEDLIEEMIEGSLKEVPVSQLGGRTPRYAMQTLGTEWGRDLIGSDFWVNIARESILYYTNVVGIPVVIDDMRFANEAAMVRRVGGHLVRVSRDRIYAAPGLAVSQHCSEGALDWAEFDSVIDNNGTLEDLQRAADHLNRRVSVATDALRAPRIDPRS